MAALTKQHSSPRKNNTNEVAWMDERVLSKIIFSFYQKFCETKITEMKESVEK